MTKEEFVAWALSRGWHADRYGHLQKEVGDKQYRMKISNVAVRYESRITFADGKHEWVRLRSGYYKNLRVMPDGTLAGLKL